MDQLRGQQAHLCGGYSLTGPWLWKGSPLPDSSQERLPASGWWEPAVRRIQTGTPKHSPCSHGSLLGRTDKGCRHRRDGLAAGYGTPDGAPGQTLLGPGSEAALVKNGTRDTAARLSCAARTLQPLSWPPSGCRPTPGVPPSPAASPPPGPTAGPPICPSAADGTAGPTPTGAPSGRRSPCSRSQRAPPAVGRTALCRG